jgi:hypothetical protein
MKVYVLMLAASICVTCVLGCSRDTASIRSCERRDWPNAPEFDAKKWKSNPDERIAFVSWLEKNLSGVATKDVVGILGEPRRRDLIDGVSETLIYSLGTGDFVSCGVKWVRELHLVVHSKNGVVSVSYTPRVA